MDADLILGMAGSLVPHISTIVVLTVGIVLAAQHRQRRGRPASLALAGCMCLLASVLVFAPLRAWLPWFVDSRGGSLSTLSIAYTVVGVFQSLVAAAGFGLFAGAVFARQGKPSGQADRA